MKSLIATALSLATLCAAPAFATTINFNNPTGTLGISQAYSSGSLSVTAYGYELSGPNYVATNLYGKNDAGSEKGVGIANLSDHEINNQSFVALNVSAITGPFSLSIGSTQNQEGFKVCFTNTLGQLGGGCTVYNSDTTDPFSTPFFTSPDTYITISGTGFPTSAENVLLDSLTTSAATPEPSSLLLLGTGVLGAAGAVRRKLFA